MVAAVVDLASRRKVQSPDPNTVAAAHLILDYLQPLIVETVVAAVHTALEELDGN